MVQVNAARRPQRTAEERMPQYVVRAPDSNKRGRWVTVGYCWPLGDGKDGFSIKLNTIPIGSWDGALVCLPPFQNGEEDQSQDPSDRDFRER